MLPVLEGGLSMPAGKAKRSIPWFFLEQPALFNDKPFSNSDWEHHHSWLRHLPEPAVFVQVAKSIFPLVLWSMVVSVAVGLYAQLLQPKQGWPVAVSQDYLVPFTLSSFAISLLLVFRTNSSYNRWWEARKSFGRIYNNVRIIARLSGCWIGKTQPVIAANIIRYTSVLCAAACAFLTEDHEQFLSSYAGSVLTQSEYAFIKEHKQPPLAVMQLISILFKESDLTVYERCEMERQLEQFDISIGACERIRGQPIPLAYTRHNSRLIISFITWLPFALWAYAQWLTIPIMAALTFLLVGIENIGIQIEQPMMVLPLKSLSDSCRGAVEAIADSQGWASNVISGKAMSADDNR